MSTDENRVPFLRQSYNINVQKLNFSSTNGCSENIIEPSSYFSDILIFKISLQLLSLTVIRKALF